MVQAYFDTFMLRIREFWAGFNLREWSESIGGSSAQAIEVAIYFGLSFATGFLFKKYFKFIFLCAVISALFIALLDYNNLITIDWIAVKGIFGFAPTTPAGDIFTQYVEILKANMLVVVATLVGFLIGYKLG